MLIPNQLVEVKIARTNIEHYKNLGYNVKFKDVITVPAEQLSVGSHVSVWIKCDVCNKEYQKPYKSYIQQHKYDMDVCSKCKTAKTTMTCREKYGVDNIFQVDAFKNKYKQTCQERYGYEYISQVPEIRNLIANTFVKKYGVDNPMKNDDVKQKLAQTNIARYGVPNAMQNKEICEKAQQTNILKYGYKSVLQNPEIKEKQMLAFYNNGTIPTSSQQLKIYDIIKRKYQDAELNYPFSKCSLDIFLSINSVNIDIEYDGNYWHSDINVDIRRDRFLQSHGFKVLRIRSGHKIPTETELFDALDELTTTDRVFKEIVLSDWKSKQYEINKKQEVSV